MPAARGYPWCTPEFIETARAIVARATASGGKVTGRLALVRELGVAEWKAQIALQILRGTRPMPEPVQASVFPPVPATVAPVLAAVDPTAAILRYLRQARTVEELADLLDCSPLKVRGLLAAVEEAGQPLRETEGRYWLDRDPAPAETRVELPAPNGTQTVRFGFVSDTHLGSTRQQITFLREDYQRMADAGITTVLHAGDMLAGVNVYRGQAGDLFKSTYEAQADYAIEHYPRIDGVTTMAISGNHDLAGLKSNGMDPLKRIAMARPDIQYLGAFSAWLVLGSLRIYLLHPDGGAAYAKSYKLQKLAEAFTGGEKPHCALVGHWHSRAYVDERNIHLFLAGCYEAQTDYERRKILSPVIGGGIIEIDVEGVEGFHAMTPTFFRHMVPKENDR